MANLQETVTVSGSSPIVDSTTTTMGTNFTKELLTEIPNARDVWASMSQAPGIQMQGFDVGGSHAGTSTNYVTYGLDIQNQTRIEGVDTTEGVSGNAGYFDFGSFEEFQVGGAGSNAESFAPGGIACPSASSPAAIASRATGIATGRAIRRSPTTFQTTCAPPIPPMTTGSSRAPR